MSNEYISVSYILPIKDLYSCQSYGAVSLVVSEFINFSNHDQHYVFGKKHTLKVLEYGKFIPRKVIPILWVGKSHFFSLSCLFYIKTKLYKNNIVEIHNRPKLFRLFNFMNKHVTIFFHNDPLQMLGSQSVSERQYLLKYSSRLFFNSDYTKGQFLKNINHSSETKRKCVTIYPAFNFKKYNMLLTTAKSKTIIFVGPLIPNKGCLELLNAFIDIKKECAEWQVVIVGPRTKKYDGYVKKVKNAIVSLNSQVTYYDYQAHEEVLKLFASAEIACLPSQWEEPFGRVIMESMAMGCATITSKRGGIPEVAGDSALVIEPSVQNLKDAMLKLTRNQDYRQELQVKARERIQEKFNIDKASKGMDIIRNEILSRNA